MASLRLAARGSFRRAGAGPDRAGSERLCAAPAHAAMLVASAVVATTFPVAAAVTRELDPAVATLARFLAAAALFLPYVAWRHRSDLRPSPRALIRHALTSAPLAAFFVAMFTSLRTASPVVTGALFTLAPAFALLGARMLGGERTSPARSWAVGAGVAGAAWVALQGALHGDPRRRIDLDFGPGELVFLAGTAGYGLHLALVRTWHREAAPAVTTFWTLATGSVWLSLAAAPAAVAVRWSDLSGSTLTGLAYLTIAATLGTFLLTQWAVRRIGAVRASSYVFLNPVLVALAALGTGGVAIDPAVWPGLLVTVAAVALVQRSEGA